ncbi:haloacid dehalogenase, partial [Streptomyces humidus]|uniref:haloacid dehalogenase n=1 Tax=Streptomyces humidus TaxID=52259 RepID=UPI003D9DC7E1
MSRVQAVLFARDGTLVEDVPDNADPDRVRPIAGAREAVGLLRLHCVSTGFVTEQSGVASGVLTDAGVRRVDRRVDDLLGPFDMWGVCPHAPDDGCHCRVPEPGLILWRSHGCARPHGSAWSSVTSARTSKPPAGRAATAPARSARRGGSRGAAPGAP